MSVTGTMLAPTDDSSDSESDDEILPAASEQAAVPRLDLSKLISQHVDDDDADIEYGDGAVLKRPEVPSAQPIAPVAVNTGAATTAKPVRINLIDAMAEAVEEIEAELQGRLFVTPPAAATSNSTAVEFSKPPSNYSSSNDKKASASTVVQQQSIDESDAFGIAYRPAARLTSSQEQGYSIPSGPAFADEQEFETELSSEFAPNSITAASNNSATVSTALRNDSNDDDDEFEFDDSCAVATPAVRKHSISTGNTAAVDNTAILKHLQAAHQLSVLDVTDPLALCDDTIASTPVAAEIEPAVDLEVLLKGVQNSTGGGGLNALDTLKNMYSTSYVTDDDNANDTAVKETAMTDATAETNAVKTECIVSQVIDEGDENDDDIEVDDTEPVETVLEVESTEPEQPEQMSAADEWSAIEALQQQHHRHSASFDLNSSSSSGDVNTVNTAAAGAAAAPVSVSLLRANISVKEALKLLRQVDMSSYRALIVPTEFVSKGFTLLQKTPVLKVPNADVQRDEVFLLAQAHYNPDNTLHQRLLQTVYRAFTGNSSEICIPNTGTHWDAIGFQGIDPCTDLNRSQGILSILQVMMFIEQQHEYAAAIHRASAVSGALGWPFMCVAIGFTKEAVGVFRRGACYTECNACTDSLKAVMTVLAQLQQAQFHDFHTRCKAAPAVHHAMHLAKTRECILKTPNKLLKAYLQYLSKSSSSSSSSSANNAIDSSMIDKYLSPYDKDSAVTIDADNFSSDSNDVSDTTPSVHQRLRAYRV
jgi:ELMO/CED-12 family